MRPIRHILVAHDFGEIAEHALDLALDLAEKLGARVTILHSYELPAYYATPGGMVFAPEMSAQLEQAARAALDGVASRARRPTVEVQVALRGGSAFSEIDAAAQQLEVDLIVMGTHGRKGIARALIGSVAERVVRTASVPVLTVHG